MEPIVTIAGLVVFAVGLLAYLLFKNEDKDFALTGVFISVVICAVCLLYSSVEVVQSNSVELPITFGKVGAPMKSGLHLKNPFTKVAAYDTRNVTSARLADKNEGDLKKWDCVQALDANRAEVCIDLTLVARLDPNSVGMLYKQYKDFDDAKGNMIRRAADAAVIKIARDFSVDELSRGFRMVNESKVYFQNELEPEFEKALEKIGFDIVSLNIGKPYLIDPELLKAYNETLKATESAKRAIEIRKQQLTEAETARLKAELDAKTAIIKAQGIADARNAEAASLTPAALQKLYIEAIDKAGTVIVTDGKTYLMLAPTPTTVK